MVTLPEGIDDDFLTGCSLRSVEFGGVNLGMNFSKPIQYGGEHLYRVAIGSQAGMKFQIGDQVTYRDSARSNLKTCIPILDFLINHSVTGITLAEDESLEIRFENSRQITLYRDWTKLDEYTIYFDNGEVLEVYG